MGEGLNIGIKLTNLVPLLHVMVLTAIFRLEIGNAIRFNLWYRAETMLCIGTACHNVIVFPTVSIDHKEDTVIVFKPLIEAETPYHLSEDDVKGGEGNSHADDVQQTACLIVPQSIYEIYENVLHTL